jgi:hypothetical protein
VRISNLIVNLTDKNSAFENFVVFLSLAIGAPTSTVISAGAFIFTGYLPGEYVYYWI